MSTSPFAAGSTSLRLYPHGELPADQIVDVFRAQATAASRAGFDGVMTSEHHAGFAGYLPNPIQAAGWALDAMPVGWAAPCPLLLPLRPTALVVEEIAWLAAAYPGRVGLGVAAGSLSADFEMMELTKRDLTARFATGLELVVNALQGRAPEPLAHDQAVARCAEHPVRALSAAMSVTAVRRAADLGAGLILDSMTDLPRCRELTDAFRAAGGTEPVVMVRRVWSGRAPSERHQQQVGVYAGYAGGAAHSHWSGDAMIRGDATEIAEGLIGARESAGADALNLRVHVPGLEPAEVSDQIAALADVLRLL